MQMLTQWEQTAVFNPSDPTQLKIARYAANPGGWTTYYFNRVKPTGALAGPTLGGPFTDGIANGIGFVVGAAVLTTVFGVAHGYLAKKGKGSAVAGVAGIFKRRRRR